MHILKRRSQDSKGERGRGGPGVTSLFEPKYLYYKGFISRIVIPSYKGFIRRDDYPRYIKRPMLYWAREQMTLVDKCPPFNGFGSLFKA